MENILKQINMATDLAEIYIFTFKIHNLPL